SAYREEWDLKGLVAAVGAILPVPVTAAARWATMNAAEVEEDLLTLAEQAYTAKEAELGPDLMRQAERLVMLRAVDSRWVRHLTDLDSLREGIGLRAYGQQDPLVAYKREAHEMYQQLLVAIQSDIVHSIFHTAVQRQPVRPAPPVLRTNRDGQQATSRPATARKAAVPAGESGAAMPLGRNDLCWCGSGKKYKHCHMQTDRGAQGGSSRPVAAGSPQPAKTGAGPGRKQRQRR
ncbi:MAG: SEC-C domain-containing protein, partial [Anaerolineae bacterium]|nr:SEC-C domain-containing protein [Anaerolineae bacterium]